MSRRAALVFVAVGVVIGGLAAGVVVLGTQSTVAAAGPSGCGGSSPQLTVTGTGLATGTPDLLTVTVSVNVTGSSAQAAMSSDDSATASVISALTGGGVAQRDVQTTGLSLEPNYVESHGTTVLDGYSVDNEVVASIHDIATAGTTVDSITTAAGDAVQIQSLQFSIADPRALEDTARQDAVHQAVAHAATMAAAAGERLGQVCSLTDQTSSDEENVSPDFGAIASASKAPSVVPLEAGTQQESAQVRIVYSLTSPATR